jgi:hypothetical protein
MDFARFIRGARGLTAVAVLSAAAAQPGCSCSSASSPPPTAEADDSGEPDASYADGPVEGGTAAESGTAEAGTNGDASEGGACNSHLPAGFSQALASGTVSTALTGNSTGRTVAMALDENDDPMFVYVDAPTGDPNYLVMFTRWDPCAGAFTTPVQVDTNHAGYDVSIAYDPSTKEVAIAYVKAATDDDWADTYSEVWLASMRPPATSFSLEALSQSHTCCHGNGTLASWPALAPSIAMHAGSIYVAFVTSVGGGGDDEGLVWFLSSSPTYMAPPPSADGTGEWDGSADNIDAGPLVHDFAYTAVPFSGTAPTDDTTPGYAFPVIGSSILGVAVDSTGTPGLAVYEANGSGYANFRALFWRPGMASAVVANEFDVDGAIDLSLAFDGTSPVIAGHMVADSTSDSLTVVSSSDGTTWDGPVVLPDGATAATSALALDGTGNAAIASDTNGTNPTCAANPYIAFSPDDGTTWNPSCPATATQGYGTHSISAAYGHGRLAGKLVVGFVNDSGGSTAPTQSGIVTWQSP